MNFNIFSIITVIYIAVNVAAKSRLKGTAEERNSLIDHTSVTDSNVFPYVVAILKKFSYFSAGVLLNDKWVLTAADAFYLIREFARVIRVRLGSINYKKGGLLLPVKIIEVHPYFDDSKPAYDIALLMLAHPVRFTPNLQPIRLQTKVKEVTATHFIVTAWTPTMYIRQHNEPIPMDVIKQHRMLSLSHLHPSNAADCKDELNALEINETETLMCLDPDFKTDSCWRDTGAPVVLNGVLWGVVSSWRPEDCSLDPGSSFVTLVAAHNISSWIHSTTLGVQWNYTTYFSFERSREDYSNEV